MWFYSSVDLLTLIHEPIVMLHVLISLGKLTHFYFCLSPVLETCVDCSANGKQASAPGSYSPSPAILPGPRPPLCILQSSLEKKGRLSVPSCWWVVPGSSHQNWKIFALIWPHKGFREARVIALVKSMYCSCRGPTLGSQLTCQVLTITSNFSSMESSALF